MFVYIVLEHPISPYRRLHMFVAIKNHAKLAEIEYHRTPSVPIWLDIFLRIITRNGRSKKKQFNVLKVARWK